jgi:AAA+ ATPase superfamily predicted ATPase
MVPQRFSATFFFPTLASSWRGLSPFPCPYFDTRPKEDRSLIYGRDAELKDITNQLDAGFWTLIVGPKRIGKTSILKVVSKERNGVFIDGSTCLTVSDLGNRIIDAISVGIKTKITVDLKIVKAEFEKRPLRTLEQFLRDLPELAIALDEIQNINDPTFTKLLSVVYNESEIKFMFSGSAIGMMKRLSSDPSMLGRPTEQIEIEPFDIDTSKGFLKNGFDTCDIKYEDIEVDETVKTLGGIPGWLSYYGAKRSQGISHESSIKQVKRNAKAVLNDELKNLGSLELAIIKAVSSLDKGGSWTEIKALGSAYYGKDPDDKSLKRSIDALMNMKLVRKTEGRYELVDPLYKLTRE